MDAELVQLLALVGGLVVSRFVSESGLKLLSASEKAQLLDGFSTMRLVTPVLALGLVGLSIFEPGLIPPLAVLLLAIMLLLGSALFAARKIQALGLPQAYLVRHVCSQGIIIAAIVAYVVLGTR